MKKAASAYTLIASGIAFVLLFSLSTAADTSSSQFETALHACIDNKKLSISPDLLSVTESMYSGRSSNNSIYEVGKYLESVKTSDRGAAYGLYQQCVADILLLLTQQQLLQQQTQAQTQTPTPTLPQQDVQQQLPTVAYKVCTGEREGSCQPHDVYLYCYGDLKAWAAAKCTVSSISHYNTYGGNKCGYSMDLVSCTGPK